jgi:hypothetical protein
MAATVTPERSNWCPRCGGRLRFTDEDGVRECGCGWSERRRAVDGDPADALDDEEDVDAGDAVARGTTLR